MFLNFATFSEISRKLGEQVSGFSRYIRDFASVLCAYDMDLSLEKIRVITGLSTKLVKEYIELIERFDRPEYQTILKSRPRGGASPPFAPPLRYGQRIREPLVLEGEALMPYAQEKSSMEKSMEPLLSKSLRNMIRHKFITEYGYSDAVPLAEFITGDLMELIQSIVFDANTLKPGQLVWMAVEKEHRHKGYGTHLYDMPMKPVVLTPRMILKTIARPGVENSD